MMNGRETGDRLMLHLTGGRQVDRLDDRRDGFYELTDNERTRRWKVAVEAKDADRRGA